MAMRLSGLMSGMDTESIVAQLVEARKTKVTKAVKAQKSLKYKQDAWKDLNKQILNLYNKSISDMRFENAYIKKTTKVSNSSVVSVITGEKAMNSVQSLQVSKLAKTGFLTGGELESKAVDEKGNPIDITGKTTLGELGLDIGDDETGNMVVTVGGKNTTVTVSKNTTVDSFLGTLRNLGLNVNLDETNKRIYISSKSSGAGSNDFSIKAGNINGLKALESLKLDYDDSVKDENGNTTSALKAYYQSVIDDKDTTKADRIAKQLESYVKNKGTYQSGLGSVLQGLDGKSLNDIRTALSNEGKDFTQTVSETDEDGNTVTRDIHLGEEGFDYSKLTDEDWKAVNAAVSSVICNEEANTDRLTAAEEKLSEAQEALKNADPNDADAYAAAQKAVEDAQAEVTASKNLLKDAEKWTSNWKSLETVNTKLKTVDGKTELSDDEKKLITDAVDAEVKGAEEYLKKFDTNGFNGQKAAGEDAEIYLNGVKYTSSKNTFDINGLTLTVSATTDMDSNETVTITTEDDTNGIYDMIKGFIKEYSTLINKMDKLYNAESAKGYDPLTDEEKEAMSDSQIEEWENKIKDSILRKDGTLGNFANELKRIMAEGVEVNGKKMYLSNFGIGTLSYFSAPDNEKNAYHIDGDPDDESTSGNPDKLKAMIANDPDTVVSFFTKLSQNLYSKMFDMMKAEDGISSSMTAYEDKKMQSDYDDYTAKIKELEKKLADYEDKWYAKFAAMETALAKMQNNASAVTSLLGG